MADSFVKKAYGEAQEQVDAQSILDKYNAATTAQFNVQREKNRQAENQFYNQMYNTQKTAMDTIRQSNAAAVSSGASRGIQAANELSALLGLEQESVASATELAQANRQTAQEETAAVLENVLNAYQQEQQEKSQYVQQTIEAASLKSAEMQAQAQVDQAKTERDKYLLDLKVNDPDKYYQEIAKDNTATDFTNMTPEQHTANMQNADNAIVEIANSIEYNDNDFDSIIDWGQSGADKTKGIQSKLESLYTAYGLDTSQIGSMLDSINSVIKDSFNKNRSAFGTTYHRTEMQQAVSQYIQEQFNSAYKLKYNAMK